MSQTQKPDEIKSLTGLRGLAAFLVMLYHFNVQNFLPYPLSNIIWHGYLSVDLFFILSGFVLALNYAHYFKESYSLSVYKNFMMSRIARVYPLYFFMTLITLVYYAFSSGIPNDLSIRLPLILTNFLMIQSWGIHESIISAGWSISTEFLAYILFPILVKLVLYGRPSTANFLLVFSVVTLIALYSLPDGYWGITKHGKPLNIYNGTTTWPILRCLAEFILGLFVYRFYKERKDQNISNNPESSFVIAVLISILMLFRNTDILIVFLFPALIFYLVSGKGFVSSILGSKLFYGLGLISYSLYLVHLSTFWIKAEIKEFIVPFSSHAEFLTVCTQIGLSIIFAIFLYSFIEKPGRSTIQRLIKKR